MSAVSYENLGTRKVKTTPRRIGTRILHLNKSGRKSPVFNSIANRPSTKRKSILVSPNTPVFDTFLQNRCSGLAKEESSDLIDTSINSINTFFQNNSFLFESTSTVTEKSGDVQDQKPSHGQAMEKLKILCIGNVPSLDVTSHYVKSAQSEETDSSRKKHDNMSNCLIMRCFKSFSH